MNVEVKVFVCYLFNLMLITFAVSYLYHFDNRLFIHQDLAFYANIGSSLYNNKVEIVNTDPFIYGQISAGLYHFFNEWLVAFFLNFTNITSFSSLKSLLLLVIPVLSTISLMGALSIVDRINPKQSYFYKNTLSFLFILLPGILSYGLNLIINQSFIADYSILQGGIEIIKDKIIVILLLLYIVSNNDQYEDKNLLPLALIPIIWPSLIPPFLGGVLMFLLYCFYKKNYSNFKNASFLLLSMAYIPVYVTIFDNFYGSTVSNTPNLIDYGLIDYIVETYIYPFGFLKVLFTYVLPTIISFFVILNLRKIISKLGFKSILKFKIHDSFIALYFFIFIAMAFSFGLLHELFNAEQMISNLIYPLLNILLFIVFLLLLRKIQMAGLFVVLFVYLFVCVNAYLFVPNKFSLNFNQSKVLQVMKIQNKNVYIATDVTAQQTPLYYYAKPFAYLLMYSEKYKPIKLNLFNDHEYKLPKDKYEYFGSVSNQSFFKYVKSNNLFSNIDNAKKEFIEEFKIDYLLISDDHLILNSYVHQLNIDSIIQLEKGISLVKIK